MESNKDINWEERRFWAATIILAGMNANFQSDKSPYNAIMKADELIKILADPKY